MAQCTEAEFVAVFTNSGAAEAGKRAGITERGAYKRRDRLEKEIGVKIEAPTENKRKRTPVIHKPRIEWTIENGVVIAFSDAHYWPNIISTAHRALVMFCKKLKPIALIANGDMTDGASISRHAPLMWEDIPTVAEDLECTKERLGEIVDAAPDDAEKAWTLGNHDARFEARLASVAPEYANVHGMHLKDHFPDWEPCWSVWINGKVVIKHRWKGGVHATHNNAMGAGLTMVTGHLHAPKVTPYTDYTGNRYGVDLGTLADPAGPQFAYTEDNPRNHRSAFGVLTFDNGRLLMPELVQVLDEQAGEVEFRGKVWRV